VILDLNIVPNKPRLKQKLALRIRFYKGFTPGRLFEIHSRSIPVEQAQRTEMTINHFGAFGLMALLMKKWEF
jgi:hypothetical protein